jgi:hypothetical protein
MKKLSALLLVVALSTACGKNAPVLTPDAQVAFNKVRVINALNLLRDIAVTANNQTPPVISADTLAKVQEYHTAAITITEASSHGWAVTLVTGLNEFVKATPEHEQTVLAFYTELVKSILTGLK